MRFNNTASKQDVGNMHRGLNSDLVNDLVGKHHIFRSLATILVNICK